MMNVVVVTRRCVFDLMHQKVTPKVRRMFLDLSGRRVNYDFIETKWAERRSE